MFNIPIQINIPYIFYKKLVKIETNPSISIAIKFDNIICNENSIFKKFFKENTKRNS